MIKNYIAEKFSEKENECIVKKGEGKLVGFTFTKKPKGVMKIFDADEMVASQKILLAEIDLSMWAEKSWTDKPIIKNYTELGIELPLEIYFEKGLVIEGVKEKNEFLIWHN